MELLNWITDLFTDEGVRDIVAKGGYLVLFLIIFAETGLLIGFFLPGDSLLVTTGLLIAIGAVDMNIFLLNILLISAAIIGDAVGYYIGKRMGQKLYEKPDGKIFKREHIIKTHEFYEKHGGKTIIIARFVPIVRTFAPVVAGAAQMTYRKFATYNIVGGILWISVCTFLGYILGNTIPNVTSYLHYILGAVILISILPPAIEILKERKRRKNLRATAEQTQGIQ